MRLVLKNEDIELLFAENEINVLVLENKKVFQNVVCTLHELSLGNSNNGILSNKDKQLNSAKKMEVIFNPFSLDVNQKKILNEIYAETETIALTNYYEDYCRINSELVNFIATLTDDLPYATIFDMQANVTEFLKLYSVKIENTSETLLESIRDYISLLHKVLGIDLFVFINLKDYFLDDQMIELYKDLFYEKVHILLVESKFNSQLIGEKVTIVDEDCCKLEL